MQVGWFILSQLEFLLFKAKKEKHCYYKIYYSCILVYFLECTEYYTRCSITCIKNSVKCFIFFVTRSIPASWTADRTKNYDFFFLFGTCSGKKPPLNGGFPSSSSTGRMLRGPRCVRNAISTQYWSYKIYRLNRRSVLYIVIFISCLSISGAFSP